MLSYNADSLATYNTVGPAATRLGFGGKMCRGRRFYGWFNVEFVYSIYIYVNINIINFINITIIIIIYIYMYIYIYVYTYMLARQSL